MPSSHLILCRPLLLRPSIFPSIKVFPNESALHIRWPKYWSFSFNIRPSNEHPGLISFRIDWLDLLAVQGTLKSLLQYHSSKASILQRSAFFIVPLSYVLYTVSIVYMCQYQPSNFSPFPFDCCSCQSLSHVWLFATPWTAACQASLSFTISQSLLELMSIESMMPSNHLILCCPFSSCLQFFPVSGSFLMIQLFASGDQSIEASASALVLPVNIQDWFPWGFTGLIHVFFLTFVSLFLLFQLSSILFF